MVVGNTELLQGLLSSLITQAGLGQAGNCTILVYKNGVPCSGLIAGDVTQTRRLRTEPPGLLLKKYLSHVYLT